MGNDVIDDLDRRLRAARPAAAEPEWGAVDDDLLARVREQPLAARRTLPRAVPIAAAAGVTLTAAVAVMLAGGPGDIGGPSSAAAISQQALRWLEPAGHTVLHTRAIETRSGTRTAHEYWVSADNPADAREIETGDGGDLERSGDAFYDAMTNTIYDPPAGAKTGLGGTPVDKRIGATDPMVLRVRTLLRGGDMTVSDRTESIAGVQSWKISLKSGLNRRPWSMWVDASNGKPIELRDPGDGDQVIRWTIYEVLPDSHAASLTTLEGAHPTARVVRDQAQIEAAQERLFPGMKQKQDAVKRDHAAGGPKKP
jgi:hypothetical protein